MKFRSFILAILIIVKQFFHAVFAGVWGVVGILSFIAITRYLEFSHPITINLAINLLIVFIPVYWVVSVYFESKKVSAYARKEKVEKIEPTPELPKKIEPVQPMQPKYSLSPYLFNTTERR